MTTDTDESAVGCMLEESTTMTECLVEAAFSAGPTPSLMGLMFSGTLLTSLYLAGNGSIIVPAVVTILLGSAMISVLPAQFVTFAYTVVAIGVAAAMVSAWNRFTQPTGFQ